MQRIDENTYIDDTLVTCVEYQLFIDEMREQGKYYQPDHWTSYQFPQGQAREPILGVRYSDAVAFCEWLTNRESAETKFRLRLPTQLEADAFPIEPIGISPLGYWLKTRPVFAWTGTPPEDARGIVLNASKSPPLLSRGLANFYIYDLDYDNDRTDAFFDTFNHAFTLSLNRARRRALSLTLDRHLDYALLSELDLILNRLISLFPKIDIDPSSSFALQLDNYIDLLTLQERIAGRSPAFEGIRLVKERIR